MKLKQYLLILSLLVITLLFVLSAPAKAAIWADYSDSNFEEQFKVTDLQSIEMWEQPKTQYTPKNLVSEQQMRFSGKNGTNSYESYTFHVTDYDTKITGSGVTDTGVYYVQDNLGQKFKTGEKVNLEPIQSGLNEVSENVNNLSQTVNNFNTKIDKNSQNIADNRVMINDNRKMINANATNINENRKRIEVNSQNIKTNAQNIQAINNTLGDYNKRFDSVNNRINDLDTRMGQGLATVTALTSLHPNPRHQGKTQLAVGSGMYKNNFAGAIGLFHYINDRVMLNAGVAYGGSTSFAGNVGITIGF